MDKEMENMFSEASEKFGGIKYYFKVINAKVRVLINWVASLFFIVIVIPGSIAFFYWQRSAKLVEMQDRRIDSRDRQSDLRERFLDQRENAVWEREQRANMKDRQQDRRERYLNRKMDSVNQKLEVLRIAGQIEDLNK